MTTSVTSWRVEVWLVALTTNWFIGIMLPSILYFVWIPQRVNLGSWTSSRFSWRLWTSVSKMFVNWIWSSIWIRYTTSFRRWSWVGWSWKQTWMRSWLRLKPRTGWRSWGWPFSCIRPSGVRCEEHQPARDAPEHQHWRSQHQGPQPVPVCLRMEDSWTESLEQAEPSQPCSTPRSAPSRSPASGPGPCCPGTGKSPVSTASLCSLLTRVAVPISRTHSHCGCEGPWLPQWGSGAQVTCPLSLPCTATPGDWGL